MNALAAAVLVAASAYVANRVLAVRRGRRCPYCAGAVQTVIVHRRVGR